MRQVIAAPAPERYDESSNVRPLSSVAAHTDSGDWATDPLVPAPPLAHDAAFDLTRMLSEHGSTAIWIADARTQQFTYRNPLHQALAGGAMRNSGSLGEWLHNIPEIERAEVRRAYALVMSGRTEHLEYRLEAGIGGGLYAVAETCFPIFDAAGTVSAIGGLTMEKQAGPQEILYLVGDASGASSPPALRGAPGMRAKRFSCLADLLDVAGFLSPGCVIVDLANTSDQARFLDVALAEMGKAMPIILLGRHDATVAEAVLAMRNGAADYLIAPVAAEVLAAAMLRASARLARESGSPQAGSMCRDRLAQLSAREREVLDGLIGGGTNKSIARDLAISPRTVELYRARLMERMNVGNLAELLSMVHRIAT